MVCLLATIALSNAMTFKHEALYSVTSIPGHENLVRELKTFDITNSRIVFRGCNMHFATLSRDNAKGTVHIGTFAGTLIYCDKDHDSQIEKILQKTNKIQETSTEFTLYEKQ